MGITTGMLIFDDAEELDFVGPWEVFTMVRHILPDDRVVTIAPTHEPIRAAKGMRIIPDHSFADAPELDVVLVPGGIGTRREVNNPVLIDWLRKAGARCTWVTSVCTGVAARCTRPASPRAGASPRTGRSCRRCASAAPTCSSACATCATATWSRLRACRRASTWRSGWSARSTA